MQINFSKYQGTGNDFILIDNRKGSISLTQEQVKFLCDRRFGIGADGLMLLENQDDFDFKMVYFNSDGNESSMCGNGGRCISAFAKHLGVIKEHAQFLAVDGPHQSTLNDVMVSLQMSPVLGIESIEQDFYLNTGSPHYVRIVKNLPTFNVVEEGRKIRYNERFKEKGTNVNFIEWKEDVLHVRTYERGVEDETLSCGTGVTASALVAAHLHLTNAPDHYLIQTPGGRLIVKFEKINADTYQNIWLEGPAEFVFEGKIQL